MYQTYHDHHNHHQVPYLEQQTPSYSYHFSNAPSLPLAPSNPTHFHYLDPYPNSVRYPSNVTAFETRPSFYPDPNAVPLPPSWVAVQPLTNDATASTSSDASLISKKVQKRFVRNAPTKKLKQPMAFPKQPNASQNVRCELCKIECSSIQIYEKHISGKRHTRALQKIYTPSASSAVVHSGNLETKKRKLLEVGAAVQSLRMCTICNVACNGEIVFADHLTGKKHLAQVRALCSVANSNPVSACTPEANSQHKTTDKSKKGGTARCEVCKITCTSNELLLLHRKGKKHQKNLKKLQNSLRDTNATGSTVAPSPSMNVPKSQAQQVKKKKISTRPSEPEDVEAKKRKVLESGTAAGAVRMCTICGVVCNSETVFTSHLAGQKHAAMVKSKQDESGTATNVQHPVTSATT